MSRVAAVTAQALAGVAPRPDDAPSALRNRMGSEPLRILLVEDNPGDARLIQLLVAEEPGASVTVEHTPRLDQGLERLGHQAYDAVLLDLSLPGESQGLDTLEAVQAKAPGVPILVLSGLADEALAIQAVNRGAQDYLMKGDVDPRFLVRSIRYAIERHRMATEIEESRRSQLELKDRFLSHVSHELRSPLSAIYQFVTLLLDGLVGEVTEEQRDILEAVFRNTDHLKAMIEDLLEVTRAQTGKLAVETVWMDLTEVLDGVATAYRSMLGPRGLTVETELEPDLARVLGDPARVRQVLNNLLDNAAKFTLPGGTVTLRSIPDPDDPDAVRIEVQDTGCGIEPAEERQIFERLYQTGDGHQDHKAGLGLGLYICRLLVGRMDGRIGLRSRPGRGSTFWFTLPALSVRQILRPLFQAGQPLEKDSLVLLRIGVERSDGSPLRESDQVPLQRFWDVLQKCSLPDLDVLFPQGLGGEHRAAFFMALVADLTGADVLVRRIRRQLEALTGFGEHGLRATFDRRLMPLESPGGSTHDGPPLEVARAVETMIEEFLAQGENGGS